MAPLSAMHIFAIVHKIEVIKCYPEIEHFEGLHFSTRHSNSSTIRSVNRAPMAMQKYHRMDYIHTIDLLGT